MAVACIALTACGSADSAGRGAESATVVVSEIHWGDPGDASENEFVEVANVGDSPARIGGWCIRGVDFCFEKGTLLPVGDHLATPASAFGS
ncbi:MAG: Lamin Tail Domain, partial [Actinomycetota bacterium]